MAHRLTEKKNSNKYDTKIFKNKIASKQSYMQFDVGYNPKVTIIISKSSE